MLNRIIFSGDIAAGIRLRGEIERRAFIADRVSMVPRQMTLAPGVTIGISEAGEVRTINVYVAPSVPQISVPSVPSSAPVISALPIPTRQKITQKITQTITQTITSYPVVYVPYLDNSLSIAAHKPQPETFGLSAFSAEDGTLKWDFRDNPVTPLHKPAYGPFIRYGMGAATDNAGKVFTGYYTYIAARNDKSTGTVVFVRICLDANSGAVLWNVPSAQNGQVVYPPTCGVNGNYFYIIEGRRSYGKGQGDTSQVNLQQINKSTGELVNATNLKFTYVASEGIISIWEIAVTDDAVYAAVQEPLNSPNASTVTLSRLDPSTLWPAWSKSVDVGVVMNAGGGTYPNSLSGLVANKKGVALLAQGTTRGSISFYGPDGSLINIGSAFVPDGEYLAFLSADDSGVALFGGIYGEPESVTYYDWAGNGIQTIPTAPIADKCWAYLPANDVGPYGSPAVQKNVLTIEV